MAAKKDPRDTVAFWKRRYEKAQPYEDAHAVSQNKLIPVEYLEWLGVAEHVAINGLARSGNSAGFRADPRCRALIESEQRALKRRGAALREKLDKLIDQAPDEIGWVPDDYQTPASSPRSRQAKIDSDLPPDAHQDAA